MDKDTETLAHQLKLGSCGIIILEYGRKNNLLMQVSES